MAKKPLSGKEVADIGAQISQVAQGSEALSMRLQRVLMTGKKMGRGIQAEFRKVHAQLISDARNQEQQLARLQRMQARGENISSNKIKTVERQLAQSRRQIGVMDKVTASTQNQGGALRDLGNRIASTTSLTGILTSVMGVLRKAFENWLDLSRKWTAAMGNIAQQTGATASQLGEMEGAVSRAASRFGHLVGEVDGIAMGGQFVAEMTTAMRDLNDLTPDVELSLLQVSRGFGTGVEGAVQLMRTLEGIDPSANLTDFGADMLRFADSIGAQAGVLTRDFVDARASVAQFGDEGVDTFQRAALMANQFGFETRKIFDMMKGFDTFGGASQQVNQLNAMLGTSLSSFELMMEQDPSRRLEMIRGELRNQGLEWSNMSRQQRMAIAQSVNLSEDEAARVFAQGASLADLEEQQRSAAEQQARDAQMQRSNQEMMNALLTRTREVFEDISRAIQRVWNVFSRLLAPVFREVNAGMRGLIDNVREWINSARGQETIQRIVQGVAAAVRNVFQWINESMPTWEELESAGRSAWSTVSEWVEWAWEGMQNIWQTIKEDVIPWFQDTWAEVQNGTSPLNDIIDNVKMGAKIAGVFFDAFKWGFRNVIMPMVGNAIRAFQAFKAILDPIVEAVKGIATATVGGLSRVANMLGFSVGGETTTAAGGAPATPGRAAPTPTPTRAVRGSMIGGLRALPETSNMTPHEAQDTYYGVVRTLLGRGVRIGDIVNNPEISRRFEEYTPDGESFRSWTRAIYSGENDPHGRRATPVQTATAVATTTPGTSASEAAPSATATAPRTNRTSNEPTTTASVGSGSRRVEIVASDIYLNGREVGRAMFEISQRT